MSIISGENSSSTLAFPPLLLYCLQGREKRFANLAKLQPGRARQKGRKAKQGQEEISRNHVPTFFLGSVHYICFVLSYNRFQFRHAFQRASIFRKGARHELVFVGSLVGSGRRSGAVTLTKLTLSG